MARARVIPVSRECIWNATAVSLVLPAFDGIGSLGSSPRHLVYPPGSTLGECLPFPWNREAELKSTTFSSLLLFHDFLSFLFS